MMPEFLIVMGVCGLIAGLWLDWIFLSLVGLLIVPIFVAAMVSAGHGAGAATVSALLGYLLLQIGFVSSGFGAELWHARISRSKKYKKDDQRREI